MVKDKQVLGVKEFSMLKKVILSLLVSFWVAGVAPASGNDQTPAPSTTQPTV